MAVNAPYNFVPLVSSDDPMRLARLPLIVRPEWHEQVSHDIPFEDGVCGHIDLSLTAKTPLFIQGTTLENDLKRHYRAPTGQLAIPGTSIRGMIRNVVEIASFSQMPFISERRWGVRDLQNRTLYGNHMTCTTRTSRGESVFTPNVHSGWLMIGENGWEITSCEHWRVEQDLLSSLLTDDKQENRRRFRNREPRLAPRYGMLNPHWLEHSVYFKGDDEPRDERHTRRRRDRPDEVFFLEAIPINGSLRYKEEARRRRWQDDSKG